MAETRQLMGLLKQLSFDDLQKLMKTSDKLTDHTLKLIADLDPKKFTKGHRSAIYNYTGGVYQGLHAEDLSADDLAFAETHLRILSGLYGVLKPLDAVQVYRLEMGAPLATSLGKSLYAFWGKKITDALNSSLTTSGSPYLLNLASDEYFSSILPSKLKAKVIDAEFYILKAGVRKFISYDAKKARGLMAHYMIKNRITHPEALPAFDYEGYRFAEKDSSPARFIFEKKA